MAKNHNFGQILTFLAAPVPTPFLPMRVKFGGLEETHSLRLPAKFHPDRFILSSSGGEQPPILPIFAVFWTSAFCVVANWQQSDKVEHGYATTNLPLSKGIKIVSVYQRLHGEIWRTISDVQKRDEQTDKQTDKQKNSTFLAAPVVGEIRAPPNLAW